jgi:phosphomethylpyrimidine synthase
MKISQEVREYAEARGIGDTQRAVEAGLEEKAEEFRAQGARVYRPV